VYLDACVLIPLFIAEESSSKVREFIWRKTGEIMVSDLAISEFGAAISLQVRTGRLEQDYAKHIFALFDKWAAFEADLQLISPKDVARASELVRLFDLKLLTPDAIHLSICQRVGMSLVTLDKRLAQAARALGVGVLEPAC
jgi:uncharacterized protein